MRTLSALAMIVALVLGYGYYQAATHGWLYVNLIDSSVKRDAGTIRGAEICFLDGGGLLLANGKSDRRFGGVRLIHPMPTILSRSALTGRTAAHLWRR